MAGVFTPTRSLGDRGRLRALRVNSRLSRSVDRDAAQGLRGNDHDQRHRALRDRHERGCRLRNDDLARHAGCRPNGSGFAANKIIFLLLVQVVFLGIGMFMDAVPALHHPDAYPGAHRGGRRNQPDPFRHSGRSQCSARYGRTRRLAFGVYAACAVARIPMERVVRPMLPMMVVLIFTMLIITYVESLSMWLPRLLGLDQ